MTPADRQRRRRGRMKRGVIPITIDVDVLTIETLILSGRLRRCDEDNRAEIGRVISRLKVIILDENDEPL